MTMPLLDHFHPPLHGQRHWEGFHHAWATAIAFQLNEELLPPDYYAEPEITLGPEMEIDVATLERSHTDTGGKSVATATWAPPRPKITVKPDFSRLDGYEVRVYQDLDGPRLRAAIELVSPANKDRAEARETFAAKCAGYLRHAVHLVIVDIVTSRSANLHVELFDLMEIKSRRAAWRSATGLYAVAYRCVTLRKAPRLEVWPETLIVGDALPTLPLWLAPDLYVPLRLEDTYLTTCRKLRIPA
jgi:hypothetical protein